MKRRGRSDRLDDIRRRIVQFRDERDWKQFHNPKNLAEAISVEAGELLENFLWKAPEQASALTAEELAAVESELADVLIYLIYLCDAVGVDLLTATEQKLARNEARYPREKSRGSAAKYTELEP